MPNIRLSDKSYKQVMDDRNGTEKSADAVVNKLLNPDGSDLIEIMNKMSVPFTCFNCGVKCDDLLDGSSDAAMAVLRFNNGSPGSRKEPPRPASFYFECIECYRKREDSK